ncbi:alpha/beta fold hydrolase [Gordonia sp. NPDC003429]
MPSLHTYTFGPADGPAVLALHGLTGHGLRWADLAENHLPQARVVAPDLLGHGRSPWRPPWGFSEHLDGLEQVVTEYIPESESFVLLAHSFGGALAVRLAEHLAGRVRGIVLLDPAQGLDPTFALEVATDSLDHWDYADADAARAAKRAEGWGEVPAHLLEREITDHLIPRPHGRMGWRISAASVATAWSELTRPVVLPPPGIPTDVVIADRVDPPFVRPAFVAACIAERPQVRFHHVDCGHMVPFLEPDLCADLVRAML